MQTTATATRTRRKPARQQAPTPSTPQRQPMTPDQMAALDVLLAAAKPGLELAVGPAGTEVQLTARLKRAKRYGYGDVCETRLTVAFGMRNASIWRETPVFVVG